MDEQTDTTKELACSLAAMCQEARRLYEQCVKKVNDSEGARAMSETDYVDGVQQHPISKRSFAGEADRLEGELTSLLQQLHELSVGGQSAWSDFIFLAGGPDSNIAAAITWSMEHGIDSNAIGAIADNGFFLRCDFGLTKASFLAENERLGAALEANRP